MTTELTGQNQIIHWITTLGTTNIHTDVRNFETQKTVREVDSTAGADVYAQYITTVKDGGVNATFLHDGGTTYWTTLQEGLAGTLEWGEAGSALTKPKHTQAAVITEASLASPYDNIEIWTLRWRPQGARTDGTW